MRRSSISHSSPVRYTIYSLAIAAIAACADSPASPKSAERADGLAALTVAQTGTIQIVQGGTGVGTITSSPEGINCTLGGGGEPTGTCEASFPAGTVVKLTAKAADGSRFEGWAPVSSCMKPKHIIVTDGAVISCQPVFSFRQEPFLLLQSFIEGSGNVTSSPEGINCTQDVDAGTFTGPCGAQFPNGTTVTLTPTPAPGWVFAGWTGETRDCNDGVVTVDQGTFCTATFVRQP